MQIPVNINKHILMQSEYQYLASLGENILKMTMNLHIYMANKFLKSFRGKYNNST